MSPKAFVAGLDDAIDRTSRLVGRPSSVLRPFACDGNPLDCEVFLVGINPASQVPWDPYWDREACSFDKANWLVSYEKARIARKRREGKKRILKWSPTRKKIELLVEGLAPHACLETNICCVAASSQSELTDRDKQATDVFEFLMDSIEPKVIYLYGDLPLTYFWGKYGSLNQYEVTELELEYGSVIVYATCHLASRQSGVTHERVRSWARILKQEAAKVL